MFACFIDFQKALWHKGGVGGKAYDIINVIYSIRITKDNKKVHRKTHNSLVWTEEYDKVEILAQPHSISTLSVQIIKNPFLIVS